MTPRSIFKPGQYSRYTGRHNFFFGDPRENLELRLSVRMRLMRAFQTDELLRLNLYIPTKSTPVLFLFFIAIISWILFRSSFFFFFSILFVQFAYVIESLQYVCLKRKATDRNFFNWREIAYLTYAVAIDEQMNKIIWGRILLWNHLSIKWIRYF